MIGNSSKGFLSKLFTQRRQEAKAQRKESERAWRLCSFASLRETVLVAAEFAEGGAEKSLERSQ